MNRNRLKLLLVFFTLNLVAIFPVHSQSAGRIEVAGEGYRIALVFSDRDERLIRNYYAAGTASRLPPGLAKKGKLPPGLRKQLREKGSLPPGLQGRYLPGDLERALTPLPRGYVRLRVGADFVLVNSRTRAILDLFSLYQ